MRQQHGARLNRRQFLAAVTAAAGSAILAACGNENATTAPAPTGSAVAPVGSTVAPASAPTAASASKPATAMTGISATGVPPVMAGTPAPAAPAMASAPAASPAASTGKTIASQLDTAGIKRGGHLTLAATTDIQTFNPILSHDTSSGTIIDLVFDTLLYPDPDTLEFKPRLATKWDITPDGKTYTFALQEGVKWHDGMPFTADDVKLTYDLLMNVKSGTTRAGTLNDHIASVDVKDPLTVVFTLKDVIAPFLANDMYGIVPKHILGALKPEAIPTSDFSTGKPIGTGPFKMQSYKQGDNVTLAGNRDYFRGATALDNFVYKIVPDTTVSFQQLKTGEVDVGTVRAELYDEAKKQTNFETVVYDTFSYSVFAFNLDPAKTTLFQDVKVRQAMCYAVDRPGVVQKILNGLATVGVGQQPIRSYAYQPDKITLKYEFDPKKANQLLDEAGWVRGKDGIRAKDGKRLSFIMRSYTDKTVQDVMAVYQENWKDVGADMTPQYEDFSIFVNRIAKPHDFDMFYVGWVFGVDPDQTIRWSSTQFPTGLNYNAYKNEKVDALLDQATHNLDRDKRIQLYTEVQNLVAADCPALPTTFNKALTGVSKRIKNYVPNAVFTASAWDAYQWYVTDGK